ncbi:MAG: oligosaccharide flippase family protein [Candidatus Rokubacteria bacterium]|nr:oligosaccharide flippase family protein [Candidatus Rokubacteria bacterium]
MKPDTPPAPAALSRLAEGGALTLASALLSRGAGMAQTIVIARLLDPYRVGVLAVLSYVLSLAGAFADLGLPVAAMQLIAEYRASRPEALRRVLLTLGAAMLGAAGLGALVVAAGAEWLAASYREPSLGLLFRVGALALGLSILGSFLTGMLQGFQRIETLALLGPLKAITTLLVTLLLVPSLGLVGVLVGSIAAEVVAWGVAGRALRHEIAPHWAARGEGLPPGRILARAFHLAVPIVLNGLALWGTPWLVRSVLAHSRGYAEVGLYQIADSFGRLLLLFPGALAVPFVPAVAEASGAGAGAAAHLAEGALRLTVLVTLPAALFLHMAAQPLVGLVYGGAYGGAGDLAALLAMAAFLQAAALIVWSMLVGMGRSWTGFLIQAAGQAVLIGLTVLLVPGLGLTGLGVAHLAAGAAALVLGLPYLARRLGVGVARLARLLPLIVLGWLGAWAVEAVAPYGAGPGALAPAALVALATAAWALRHLTAEERAWLRIALRRLGPRP